MISSKNHELWSERQKKVALSACDDKIYRNNDNITTYNFGHCRIRK